MFMVVLSCKEFVASSDPSRLKGGNYTNYTNYTTHPLHAGKQFMATHFLTSVPYNYTYNLL